MTQLACENHHKQLAHYIGFERGADTSNRTATKDARQLERNQDKRRILVVYISYAMK